MRFSMGELFFVITIILLQEMIFANGLGNNFNVAKGKPTTSSTAASTSGRAVDGDRDSYFGAGSCWETSTHDWNPYWMVDLGRECMIESVVITNRGDCCADRLHDFIIEAFLDNPEQVPAGPCLLCYNYTGTFGATESLPCTEPFVIGRYVRIRGTNTRDFNDIFTLCEFEVYESISSCFELSYRRQSSSRSTGTVAVTSKTSRADCSSVCVRHSTCVAFNYNVDNFTCEMVTVAGSLLPSPEWDYYQINS